MHCLFDKDESLRLLEFQKSIENQKTTDLFIIECFAKRYLE